MGVVRALHLALVACHTIGCRDAVATELTDLHNTRCGGPDSRLGSREAGSRLGSRGGSRGEAVETGDAHRCFEELVEVHRAQTGHRVPAGSRVEALLAAGVVPEVIGGRGFDGSGGLNKRQSALVVAKCDVVDEAGMVLVQEWVDPAHRGEAMGLALSIYQSHERSHHRCRTRCPVKLNQSTIKEDLVRATK